MRNNHLSAGENFSSFYRNELEVSYWTNAAKYKRDKNLSVYRLVPKFFLKQKIYQDKCLGKSQLVGEKSASKSKLEVARKIVLLFSL